MGKDTLNSLAKTLSESAGFNAKHTNHSARKTFISNLLDHGVPPTEVAQISGHKNLHSLNHYHSLSLERQQQLSEVIHKPMKAQTPGPPQEDFPEDDVADQELINASQEIEKALKSIENFEEVNRPAQVVDLPVSQSPGGSLSVSNFLRTQQMGLFSGCTFNHPVNIVFKK